MKNSDAVFWAASELLQCLKKAGWLSEAWRHKNKLKKRKIRMY